MKYNHHHSKIGAWSPCSRQSPRHLEIGEIGYLLVVPKPKLDFRRLCTRTPRIGRVFVQAKEFLCN